MGAIRTWDDARRAVARRLRDAGIASADVEARWLVEEVSGIEDPLGGRQAVPPAAAARLDALVARRAAGEPLQYVLGHWSFAGLDVMVDARALIPRPETEVVAECAVEEAARQGLRRGRASGWTASGAGEERAAAADLGTGSGVLALALVAALPDVQVWATDVSTEALALARANLAGAGSIAARVRLAAGSWFDALPPELRGRLRVVVANPPYVAEGEYADLPREVAEFEPRDALVSGPTGLECAEVVVAGAFEWLAPSGALVLEHAPHHAEAVAARARARGYAEVETRADLSGRPRVLVARRGR